MEHYVQVLIEVFSSLGWIKYLCVMGSAVFAASCGMTICAAIKEFDMEFLYTSLFFLVMALVSFGIVCWCVSPFWSHPSFEIHVTVIIWLIIWFFIGFFEWIINGADID